MFRLTALFVGGPWVSEETFTSSSRASWVAKSDECNYQDPQHQPPAQTHRNPELLKFLPSGAHGAESSGKVGGRGLLGTKFGTGGPHAP